MKRDMDLIRRVMLDIEECPANQVYDLDDNPIEGFDVRTIQMHLQLLADAGFIDGLTLTRRGAICVALTWQGHDFIDAARSQTLWMKAKSHAQQLGGSMAVETLKALLIKLANDQLGL